MRFRLFRSRGFWFGLPGLVFLLWAWGDSSRWESNCSVSAGRWYGYLSQRQGYLQIEVIRGDPPVPVTFWVERSTRASGREIWLEWRYWPQWRHHELEPGLHGWLHVSHRSVSDTLILPHWFLLLLHLIPWGGVMFWRLRKRRALPPAG